MYTKQPKKLLIINILDILNKFTDENHRISQAEIVDILKREYNMEVNRKSIKPNILDLIDAGYDINYTEKVRGENDVIMTDFYINKKFTDEELRMIIDSLLFSKYIPCKQCSELVEKIGDLSSVYFKYKVKHVKNMPERYPKNNELFYSIGILDEAIENKLCVRFIYKDYDTDKKLKTRKNQYNRDKTYLVSPYQMAATNGRYYLIGNHVGFENISYYRIDRIADIKLTSKAARPLREIRGCEKGFDLPKHMAEHIYMFSGESSTVAFKAQKCIVNDILDWFGDDVIFFDETEEEVLVNVTVNHQAMKYWAMQYANYVKVLNPQSLVEEIKTDLKKALEMYNTK